jgi:hypothetical protein
MIQLKSYRKVQIVNPDTLLQDTLIWPHTQDIDTNDDYIKVENSLSRTNAVKEFDPINYIYLESDAEIILRIDRVFECKVKIFEALFNEAKIIEILYPVADNAAVDPIKYKFLGATT